MSVGCKFLCFNMILKKIIYLCSGCVFLIGQIIGMASQYAHQDCPNNAQKHFICNKESMKMLFFLFYLLNICFFSRKQFSPIPTISSRKNTNAYLISGCLSFVQETFAFTCRQYSLHRKSICSVWIDVKICYIKFYTPRYCALLKVTNSISTKKAK